MPVDLASLTAKTLELVRHDLARQSVRLETSFAPDLPPAQADPQQLQQVLLNLFGNAIQAMAAGADAWLRVEVLGVGDQPAVRVTDGGPGIAADVLPRIFDPFFSTKAEGSGLGLSVSYAIARAHGGDLRVESTPASARRSRCSCRSPPPRAPARRSSAPCWSTTIPTWPKPSPRCW